MKFNIGDIIEHCHFGTVWRVVQIDRNMFCYQLVAPIDGPVSVSANLPIPEVEVDYILYTQKTIDELDCLFGGHDAVHEDQPEYKRDYSSNQSCNHDWDLYTGFNDSYQFCKKCDIKRK